MRHLFIVLTVFIAMSCIAQSEKKTYPELLNEIIQVKEQFRAKYENADSLVKDSIILTARNYLSDAIVTEVFPYWYGTPWDFNGTTRTPKIGHIACGYFVTNILTDVGFDIPRIKWAQSASEVFIKKLAFGNIKRFSDKNISVIENHFRTSGDGLYLVGLDCHVGFVSVMNGKAKFIHADYFEPNIGVVSEDIDSENPLNESSYRVIGKLMEDEMMIRWINNIKF